jgi:hypothetical protein
MFLWHATMKKMREEFWACEHSLYGFDPMAHCEWNVKLPSI